MAKKGLSETEKWVLLAVPVVAIGTWLWVNKTRAKEGTGTGRIRPMSYPDDRMFVGELRTHSDAPVLSRIQPFQHP